VEIVKELYITIILYFISINRYEEFTFHTFSDPGNLRKLFLPGIVISGPSTLLSFYSVKLKIKHSAIFKCKWKKPFFPFARVYDIPQADVPVIIQCMWWGKRIFAGKDFSLFWKKLVVRNA
jgi:hypothetical protein